MVPKTTCRQKTASSAGQSLDWAANLAVVGFKYKKKLFNIGMVDKEKFIENIQNLLSAGQTEEEIATYIQRLGFSAEEAKQFIAGAQKGKSRSAKNLMKMMPGTMEDHLKRFAMQKKETKKELFKRNIEEMAKIMDRMKAEKPAEKGEKKQ